LFFWICRGYSFQFPGKHTLCKTSFLWIGCNDTFLFGVCIHSCPFCGMGSA
jgi:hypothetical protein